MSEDAIDGWSLFNHIEDRGLQDNNRAATIINIIKENLERGIVNQYGMYIVMKYWTALPEEERASVYAIVKIDLIEMKLLEDE